MTAPWPPNSHPPTSSAASSMTSDLDTAALKAIDKHERLLHHKTLELLLGSMIARQGVKETRRQLLGYARHLREFHT